jgi:hypothetical protein
VRKRTDNDDFPNVTFEDPRIKLGDMTGDGLQDILLIQNGHVEYWPYRGYGRWGRSVTMRDSPRFEDAVFFPGIGFDPKRLFIGDVDGDGVADFVYVSSGRITVWINRNGNSWSDPTVVHGTRRRSPTRRPCASPTCWARAPRASCGATISGRFLTALTSFWI